MNTNTVIEQREECGICGDLLIDDIFTLDCKHTYHKQCLLLEFSHGQQKGKYKCPYCRSLIKNVPLFENQIPISGVHITIHRFSIHKLWTMTHNHSFCGYMLFCFIN